jgi:hypothetical protein
MRVLLVSASGSEDLHRARRTLGYEKLVVVAPQAKAEGLKPELPEGAELVQVEGHDLLGCLEVFEGLLRRHAKDEVRMAVDGGTTALSAAAFLACLSHGKEAWFTLHKVVRLPVLASRPLAKRFADDEAAVLRALEGKLAIPDLAERCALDEERVKAALLALRRHEAVRTDAGGAQVTELGAYYRRALLAA